MTALDAFAVGLMIGLFVGVWAVYFARTWIWGFDPNSHARGSGTRNTEEGA